MPIVVLIPGILCILALLWGGTTKAFLNVFIPVLVVLPTSYYWTLRPIPPLGFMEATLVPLAIGMIFMDISRWRLSRSDLWMMIFIISCAFEQYRERETSAAILSIFAVLANGLFPYVMGKMLIEQPGIRLATVKRFVALLVPICLLSMVQFFTRINPFQHFWFRFFPDDWALLTTQTRHGFGRLGGPYFGAEPAGIVIFTGLAMAIWLKYDSGRFSKYAGRSFLSSKKGKIVVIFVLAVTLLMTQSRGPWIGAILCLGIASIGTAKKPRRRAFILIGLSLMVGVPGYIAAKDYVSGPRIDYGSERETAQYRAQLIDAYIPVAVAGGAWGYSPDFPRVGGQSSIDNAYLLVWLLQGYIGLTVFILLLLEATISLISLGIKAASKSDRSFAFCLLGIIIGMAFTIGTVWLGAPTYNIFFLLIGWSQAIRVSNSNEVGSPEAKLHKVDREPTLIRVYT